MKVDQADSTESGTVPRSAVRAHLSRRWSQRSVGARPHRTGLELELPHLGHPEHGSAGLV